MSMQSRYDITSKCVDGGEKKGENNVKVEGQEYKVKWAHIAYENHEHHDEMKARHFPWTGDKCAGGGKLAKSLLLENLGCCNNV